MRMSESYEFSLAFPPCELLEGGGQWPRSVGDGNNKSARNPEILAPRLPVPVCALVILVLSAAGYTALYAMAGALAWLISAS